MMEFVSRPVAIVVIVLGLPDMFACLFYRESPGNTIASAQGILYLVGNHGCSFLLHIFQNVYKLY